MGSLPLITTLHFVSFIISAWADVLLLSPVILALVINTLMLARILTGFGVRYTWYRLTRGEIIPQYLLLIWLFFYPQQEYLYSIPLMLSNIGKCYLLLNTPRTLEIDAVEYMIVLQAKFEITIVIYAMVKIFLILLNSSNPLSSLVAYLLLLLIMKVKYEIHYGTRQAYEEVHFTLDRASKGLNLRAAYHAIHRIISQFSTPWHSSKQITY